MGGREINAYGLLSKASERSGRSCSAQRLTSADSIIASLPFPLSFRFAIALPALPGLVGRGCCSGSRFPKRLGKTSIDTGRVVLQCLRGAVTVIWGPFRDRRAAGAPVAELRPAEPGLMDADGDFTMRCPAGNCVPEIPILNEFVIARASIRF